LEAEAEAEPDAEADAEDRSAPEAEDFGAEADEVALPVIVLETDATVEVAEAPADV